MKIWWIFNIIFFWLVRTHSTTPRASKTSGSYKPFPYALFMKIWKCSETINSWLWIMKMQLCKMINNRPSFYNIMFIYPTFISFRENVLSTRRKMNKKATTTLAETSDIVYRCIRRTHIHFNLKCNLNSKCAIIPPTMFTAKLYC